jgi:O-antigen/teichoic acid export membrane protein
MIIRETVHTVVKPLRRELGDVAAVVLCVGVAGVVNIVYNAIVASTLGPGAYSDFPAALALATLLSVAFGALAPVTAHLAARYTAAREPEKIVGLVGRLLRFVLAGAVIGLLPWLAAASWIGDLLQIRAMTTVVVAYAVFVAIAAAAVARSAVRGAQRFRRYGAGLVGESLIRVACGALLLYLAPNAAAALAAYAIATLIVGVDAWRVVRRLADRSVRPEWAEVTSSIGPMALLMATMAILQNLDMLIVKHYFDPLDAGIYGAAVVLARTMPMLAMPFEALLLPRLSYLVGSGDRFVAPVVRLAAGLGLAAGVPLLVFAFIPESVIEVVYGRAFGRSASLLLPLAAALFILHIAYMATQALVSMGKKRMPLLFAATIGVEAVLLIFVHDSLARVAMIILSTRSVMILILAASLVVTWRRTAKASR